jgi:hypothetical protein
VDFDASALHTDLLYDESQQPLLLVELEAVERGEHPAGKVGDAAAEVTFLGKGLPLFREAGQLPESLLASGVDVGHAPGQLGQIQQARLEDVQEPAAFAFRGT